jgi:excisionase family DNA binding protein
MAVEPAFWNLAEVATYLNERPATIREWVARRRIPFFKRGKRLQFNIDEIKKWDRESNYRPTLSEREREKTKLSHYVKA